MASCSRSEERLVNEQRRADLIKTRAAGATVPQGTARQRRPLRIAFVLSIVVAACAAGILALAGRSLRPVEARDVVPPTTAPSTTTVSNGSSFIPSIGLTRTQVESLFREIDGSHTVFRAARALHGIPRVLGSDNRLYTIIEINGYPAVTDVQVVSILETTSKATLENQVLYDSLACSALGDKAAQNWCTSRILNTTSHGLATATEAADFGPVRITVKTYQSTRSSGPAVATVNIGPT